MRFMVLRVLSAAAEIGTPTCPTAYVSCWINEASRETACEKAIALIEAQGWRLADIVEDYPITREDYELKPEGLEYYEQALIDGEVAVFFVPAGVASGKWDKP